MDAIMVVNVGIMMMMIIMMISMARKKNNEDDVCHDLFLSACNNPIPMTKKDQLYQPWLPKPVRFVQ
jgi:hypothetical protein